MKTLVSHFGQKLPLRKSPFNWALDVVRPADPIQPPCSKAPCGPLVWARDENDALLISTLNRPADGTRTKQHALCDFDMCAFGDIGNVVIFQGKLWCFVSESQRKMPPFITHYCFLQTHAIFVQFPWKEQMLSLRFFHLSLEFLVQIFKSYLGFELSFSTIHSQKWPLLPGLATLRGSPTVHFFHQYLPYLLNFQGCTFTSDVISFQENPFLCIYILHENLTSYNLDILCSK